MFNIALKTTVGAVALGLASFCATGAGAAQITYNTFFTTTDNTGTTPGATITVNDNTAGLLSFAISTAGAVTGGLSGVGFIVNANLAGMTVADIQSESAPIQDFGLDITKLGGGANFQGGYANALSSPVFSFLLELNKVDVSTTPFTFAISDSLFDLGDLGLAGLRFQNVAGVGVTQNSAKLVGGPKPTPTTVPTVPLPAAGWLMIAGLGAIAGAGKLRRS